MPCLRDVGQGRRARTMPPPILTDTEAKMPMLPSKLKYRNWLLPRAISWRRAGFEALAPLAIFTVSFAQ